MRRQSNSWSPWDSCAPGRRLLQSRAGVRSFGQVCVYSGLARCLPLLPCPPPHKPHGPSLHQVQFNSHRCRVCVSIPGCLASCLSCLVHCCCVAKLSVGRLNYAAFCRLLPLARNVLPSGASSGRGSVLSQQHTTDTTSHSKGAAISTCSRQQTAPQQSAWRHHGAGAAAALINSPIHPHLLEGSRHANQAAQAAHSAGPASPGLLHQPLQQQALSDRQQQLRRSQTSRHGEALHLRLQVGQSCRQQHGQQRSEEISEGLEDDSVGPHITQQHAGTTGDLPTTGQQLQHAPTRPSPLLSPHLSQHPCPPCAPRHLLHLR